MAGDLCAAGGWLGRPSASDDCRDRDAHDGGAREYSERLYHLEPGYLAFELEHRTWDIGLLVLFGAFGLASKLFGWNRLLLVVALAYGTVLEESIRRSMLLSQGDLAVFWGRPISATLLLLAGGILAMTALLSARRALSRPIERGVVGAS